MRTLLIIFLSNCVAFMAYGAEQLNNDELVKAFEFLKGPQARFPEFGYTDRDMRAVEVVRAHPDEFEALLKAALVKGGQRGRAASLITMVRPENQLQFLRDVIATYDIGDDSAPQLPSLIALGEEKDMELIKRWIIHDPNGETAILLAQIMATVDNKHAQSALQELRDSVPGKWQESRQVQRFFGRQQLSMEAPNKSSGTPTATPAAAEVDPAPAPAVPPSAASAPVADAAPETGTFPWFWALGALAVVIAGLAVAMRRRG